jgi:hypothetical protein
MEPFTCPRLNTADSKAAARSCRSSVRQPFPALRRYQPSQPYRRARSKSKYVIRTLAIGEALETTHYLSAMTAMVEKMSPTPTMEAKIHTPAPLGEVGVTSHGMRFQLGLHHCDLHTRMYLPSRQEEEEPVVLTTTISMFSAGNCVEHGVT